MIDSFFNADILKEIRKYWYSKRTIFIIVLLVFVLFKVSSQDYIVTSLLCVTLLIFWFLTTRLPKTKKNHIGFTLALSAETETQGQRLVNDFYHDLKQLLSQCRPVYPFDVIELNEYYSNCINSTEDAYKYLDKMKCHFMIYGKAKLRQIKGHEYHILEAYGMVRHKILPKSVHNIFLKEFAELFPRNLHISAEDDLLTFRITSEFISIIARYIIGIASFLSGDVKYAESLFTVIKKEIQKVPNNEVTNKIRSRLPARLAAIYFHEATNDYQEWKRNNNMESLDSMKRNLDKLNNEIENTYGSKLLYSIWYFVKNRDIKSAIKELKLCQDITDATWRFNMAFLYAYQNIPKSALRWYKSAGRFECEGSILADIEEFIVWFLESEPDKIQFYFYLGYFNLGN